MPLTKSGKSVLKSMQNQYGGKKGEDVFYSSVVKGLKGSKKWHGKGKGKLAKAVRTFKAGRR